MYIPTLYTYSVRHKLQRFLGYSLLRTDTTTQFMENKKIIVVGLHKKTVPRLYFLLDIFIMKPLVNPFSIITFAISSQEQICSVI